MEGDPYVRKFLRAFFWTVVKVALLFKCKNTVPVDNPTFKEASVLEVEIMGKVPFVNRCCL